MFNLIKNWWYRLKTKRVEIQLVSYSDADEMLNNGWVLALPEEDYNSLFGKVFLERRE